jgi:hypothetical protein
LLVGGTLLAVAAAWAGSPAQPAAADPELAILLRGMAVIKIALIVPALALLWWRFGFALSAPVAAGYLAGGWLIAGATALIWQLSSIALAAAVFHLAGFALLLLALADRGVKLRLLRRSDSIYDLFDPFCGCLI